MESLAFYISSLRKDFVKYCNGKLMQFQLTEGLYHFLIYVGKRPCCTLSEVSEFLHIDNAHTTRSIDKLEQLEYMQRSSDIADKRKVTLQLTEQGNQVFHQLKDLISQWDQEMLKDFSKEEKITLYHLLQKINIEL